MYYRITWQDWTGKENTITVVKADVVKQIAVLLNSVSPDMIKVELTDQKVMLVS